MKFTAGYWTIRPGVTPHFAVQVHDVETDPEGVTLYALTRRIDTRGDTLNLPLLTIRLTSPLPNVVRVQIVHHKGAPPAAPHFELFTQPPPITVHDDAEAASLTSGDLTVRVAKGHATGGWTSWTAQSDHRQRLARHRRSSTRRKAASSTSSSTLGVGECVYGLGERFTAFVKNGQVVDLWNEDGGTSSEQAYKNIPFYLTNRGYGVFINHPERVSLEVGL